MLKPKVTGDQFLTSGPPVCVGWHKISFESPGPTLVWTAEIPLNVYIFLIFVSFILYFYSCEYIAFIYGKLYISFFFFPSTVDFCSDF